MGVMSAPLLISEGQDVGLLPSAPPMQREPARAKLL